MLAGIRGPRGVVLALTAFSLCSTLVLFVFLPYDSAVLSFFRFSTQKTISFLGQPFRDEQWVFRHADFPVHLETDVALILKTGYGTQERIGAQLDALGPEYEGSLLVIADFSGDYNHSGRAIPVHNMVAAAVAALPDGAGASTDRVEKYTQLTAAIQAGHTSEARQLATAAGWELDALKVGVLLSPLRNDRETDAGQFIPGLEISYRKLPRRKWYMMIDDDTYLIKPSMRALLGHLDPSEIMYVGNAIGDFKGRFAHGGSAILLSRAAMEQLFERSRPVVEQAYVQSWTETWGDRLVATTLMKIGIYLDERFSHFFNGEQPRITRVLPDRFCSPLVSFHGLAEPGQMADTTATFRGRDRPVLWGELWSIYGQPALDVFVKNPIRRGRDHVGAGDEAPDGFGSVERCIAACEGQPECLAWTWDKASTVCRTSRWFIIGDEPEDKYSGLHVARVRQLGDCSGVSTGRTAAHGS